MDKGTFLLLAIISAIGDLIWAFCIKSGKWCIEFCGYYIQAKNKFLTIALSVDLWAAYIAVLLILAIVLSRISEKRSQK